MVVLSVSEVHSSHNAVCIVPAATIISVGWDICGAGDGEEDGEGGEGIHEIKWRGRR